MSVPSARTLVRALFASAALLAGPVAVPMSAGPAQARPQVPAEERDQPYSGLVRSCQDPMATGYIKGSFLGREVEFWHSGLSIVGFEDVHEIGFRSNGLDYIPRRYCEARAIMSDSKVRTVAYSIDESSGDIGFTDNIVWCVEGLDRNDAFSPACKMARP